MQSMPYQTDMVTILPGMVTWSNNSSENLGMIRQSNVPITKKHIITVQELFVKGLKNMVKSVLD